MTEKKEITDADLILKITEGRLAALGLEVIRCFKGVQSKKDDLVRAEDKARRVAYKFNAARKEILRRLWEKSGRGWCTQHQGKVSKDDLHLTFIEGTESVEAYEKSKKRDFRALHEMCTKCFEEACNLSHHEVGVGTEKSFLACRAERRKAGIYIYDGSSRRPLPTETRIEETIPYYAHEIQEEFGIPPEVHCLAYALEPRFEIGNKEVNV